MADRINKDELRNTQSPYLLRLNRYGLLYTEDVKAHIDPETRIYKTWHLTTLRLLSVNNGIFEFLNSNGNISYRLTIQMANEKLLITCNCDRRVVLLCHHAYTALRQLIAENGEDVFLVLKKKYT